MGQHGIFANHPKPIDVGGRALAAVIRPYALKVAGKPLKMRFDPWKGEFEFAFVNQTWLPTEVNCTEIFVPNYHFGASLATSVARNEWEWGVRGAEGPGSHRGLGHGGRGCRFSVHLSDGSFTYHPQEQLLLYIHTNLQIDKGIHTVRIVRNSRL